MARMNRTWMSISQSLLLLLSMTVSSAQVNTAIISDGTLGTDITQVGKVHEITGGTRPGEGPNLFHSFEHFDVGTGDIAHFVGASGIDAIIGRITGGDVSRIDGTLQSDATLFLLNPQGMMFGSSAALDINGSFHASTADVLRFTDGTAFSTRLSPTTTLSTASPAAFGFLSNDPAAIQVQSADLRIDNGNLSIVGGGIRIEGAASIAAPDGQLNVVSLASPGDAVLGPQSTIEVDTFDELGEIEILQGSQLTVSGEKGGGQILVRGGRLMVDNSVVEGGTVSEINTGEAGIDLVISDAIELTHTAVIRTLTDRSDRPAADIHISAGNLQMTDASLVTSQSTAPGHAGSIAVAVDHMSLRSGSQINSLTSGGGDSGSVTVHATQMTVDGTTPDFRFASGIFVQTTGTGDASSLLIEADQLTLSGGGQLNNTTFGAGNGGSVTIRANQITLDGATPNHFFPSGIFAGSLGRGDAGTMLLEADQLTLLDGAQMSSTTFGPGNGGSMTIRANDITVDGATPDHAFRSGLFANSQDLTETAGDAGTIVVEASRLTLSGGARIDSSTAGPGQGGMIRVMASEVQIAEAGTRIDAEAAAAGSAGMIEIEADRLTIAEGAQVSTSTRGMGNGGLLAVTAHESITIVDDSTSPFRSGLFSNSGEGQGGEPTGDGGDIVIRSPLLTIDGGRLLSRTLGYGTAGEITVEVDRLALLRGGQIFNGTGISQADGTVLGHSDGRGSGGTITIIARESVLITGRDMTGFSSGLFSSAQIGSGNAGSIFVSAPRIELQAGGQIGTQSILQSRGRAGDIVLLSDHILMMDQASISSESVGRGDAGNIQIAVHDIDLNHNSLIVTNIQQGEASGGNIQIGGAFDANGHLIGGAETLTLQSGSRIAANTDAGDGANIAIGVQRVMLDTSDITANTNSGNGGNIAIGGMVTVDGPVSSRMKTTVLLDGRITANAQAGRGGRIAITTQVLLADLDSTIEASSQEGGIDGEVNVEAIRTNLSEVVQPLAPRLASDTPLLSDRCAARLQQGLVSSFVERERSGTPSSPDGLLPSRLEASSARAITSEHARPQRSAMSRAPLWRVSSHCP